MPKIKARWVIVLVNYEFLKGTGNILAQNFDAFALTPCVLASFIAYYCHYADIGKHAVFCLLSVGSEVQDTDLVSVDKSSTDITFSDVVVL